MTVAQWGKNSIVEIPKKPCKISTKIQTFNKITKEEPNLTYFVCFQNALKFFVWAHCAMLLPELPEKPFF